MKTSLAGHILAAAALLLVPSGAGAVQCVNETGAGGCFKSIQRAVKAASAGEEVRVEPGFYRESVTVATSGVTIVGQGNKPSDVVVDPVELISGPGALGAPAWTGFLLDARNVSIKNLTILNSYYAVRVTAPGAAILNVRIGTAAEAGVLLEPGAADALVRGVYITRVTNDEGYGIYSAAPGLRVLDSVVRSTVGSGIRVEANRLLAKGNRIKSGYYDGIRAIGNGHVVRGNTVLSFDDDLIWVSGNNARAINNRVSASDGCGIHLEGDDPVLRGNLSTATEGPTFNVVCGECASALVAGNVGRDSIHDDGFYLSGGTPGLLAVDNVSKNHAQRCYDPDGTGVVLVGNLGRNCGNSGAYYPAFDFDHCDGCAGMRNTAESNVYVGFWVESADGVKLKDNRAVANSAGFVVTSGATNTLLGGNESRFNGWDGIWVGATDTTLVRNTSLSNHMDFCDAGLGTVAPTSGKKANVWKEVCAGP